MCDTCGCNHKHEHNHTHNLEEGHSHTHVMERDVLTYNNDLASKNRALLAEKSIKAFNFLSSPGAGKTTLLVRTIEEIKSCRKVFVIEGDQETNIDAEKIKQTGIKTIQINTGKACHLDAHMTAHALRDLQPDDDAVLFIENVGNLICPAAFDLGENYKVVILATTEGEEKPLKYPHIFAIADVVIINKIDAADFLGFETEQAEKNIRAVNASAPIFRLSAKTGEGMDKWLQWLTEAK